MKLIGWQAFVNGKQLNYPKDYTVKGRSFIFTKKPKKNSIVILKQEYIIK